MKKTCFIAVLIISDNLFSKIKNFKLWEQLVVQTNQTHKI